MTDITLNNYYYGEQLKRYIIEYMAIFSGLKVAFGKNSFNSETNLVEVPISYGSKDRVVAGILAENTQNKPIRVPALSANMVGIENDPSLWVGVGQVKKDVRLPLGASLPDGLTVVSQYRPIPYRMRMETVVYASNSDQHCQMLEQILMLFDPILQIQTDDAFGNRSKITTVTLENIGLDETYPTGNQPRIITTTLSFSFPIQLAPPTNLREKYIQEIKLRISAIEMTEDVHEFTQESGSDEADYTTIIDSADMDIPLK